jgi:hypothetical protein
MTAFSRESRPRLARLMPVVVIVAGTLGLALAAYVYRYDGRTFAGLKRFYAAQDRARSEGLGVWGSCDGDFHSARPGRQD